MQTYTHHCKRIVDNNDFFSHAGNDLLEYSPYEQVNSRLSDIFRLAPIIAGKKLLLRCRRSSGLSLDIVESQVLAKDRTITSQSCSKPISSHNITVKNLSLFDNHSFLPCGFRLQLSTAIIHHKSFYLILWPAVYKAESFSLFHVRLSKRWWGVCTYLVVFNELSF